MRLQYTRPQNFQDAPGLPDGFVVITNADTEPATDQYEGIWNDATRTLTARVPVPVDVPNIVYVVDDVVPSFLPTVLTADRGRLRQIDCPSEVTGVQICYDLTVASGQPSRPRTNPG